MVDFGDPKFGTTSDSPQFVGRRVDLIGRSMRGVNRTDPAESIQRYLRAEATQSAHLLAQKAVVLLDPVPLRGTIVWPVRYPPTICIRTNE